MIDLTKPKQLMPDRPVRTQCPNCRKVEIIQCPEPGFTTWANGDALIQDAMPTLTTSQREQLMTGICAKCWDHLFAEDEDEDTAIGDDVIASDAGDPREPYTPGEDAHLD
jgi:hypothetical protein